MRYTNHKDWCDDCCWEYPTRKGMEQMHNYPCDCVCHHPERIEKKLDLLLSGSTPSFDQPGDW